MLIGNLAVGRYFLAQIIDKTRSGIGQPGSGSGDIECLSEEVFDIFARNVRVQIVEIVAGLGWTSRRWSFAQNSASGWEPKGVEGYGREVIILIFQNARRHYPEIKLCRLNRVSQRISDGLDK